MQQQMDRTRMRYLRCDRQPYDLSLSCTFYSVVLDDFSKPITPAYDDVERKSMYQKVQYFILSKNVARVLAE